MNKAIKVGFIHLPGINDEAWAEHLADTVQGILSDVTIEKDNSNITFTVPSWIDKEVAVEVQKQLSYHPAGYSFHSYNKIQTTGGHRTTTWKCWRSCD